MGTAEKRCIFGSVIALLSVVDPIINFEETLMNIETKLFA